MEELSRRARAKRHQILYAAQELFLQQGFERTTMDAITLAARVSKQTLYHYFASKEQLFAAILQNVTHERTWQNIQESPEIVIQEMPLMSILQLEQVLARLAQSLIKSLMHPTYLALLRIVIAEMAHFPYLLQLFRQTVTERGMRDILALLLQAQVHGLIAGDIDLDFAVRLFIGPLLTYVISDGLFAPIGEPHLPQTERIVALVHLYIQAISTLSDHKEEQL
jgi:TetR/AcrR family transcriptional repressor of mexJK operon